MAPENRATWREGRGEREMSELCVRESAHEYVCVCACVCVCVCRGKGGVSARTRQPFQALSGSELVPSWRQ